MKKISLAPQSMLPVIALVVMLITVIVPATAELVSIPLSDTDTTSYSYESPTTGSAGSGPSNMTDVINVRIYNIEKHPQLKTVYVRTGISKPVNPDMWKEYDSKKQQVDLVIDGVVRGHGTIAYNCFYTQTGSMYEVQYWLDISDFDISGLTGTKDIIVTPSADSPLRLLKGTWVGRALTLSDEAPAVFFRPLYADPIQGYYIVNDIFIWENTVNIVDDEISIIRNGNFSVFNVSSQLGLVSDTGVLNKSIYAVPPLSWEVTNSRGKIFNGTYGDSAPKQDSIVTIYIKNSQTGAAIANSKIVIDALVNGEYYPVANTTEPSGIFSITLQPTGGGQPNPDAYRLIATADGYNNPMPEINFTVTDSKKYIYCYLDPIAGGPENENNTFIDFYVRDLSANPVSGATVKFGKYTLITNSYGYTVFEVPKNTDYTYTVSKSGYGPVTGNANIGANNRYIINAVIGLAVTPTTPTAIPTDTQTGPTPTLTAPTGEPVNNLLEWFAAHFGMVLGGGVEIGKIFMWLCFTLPVGVYVGKESKAGAAGFMAGAGIVTLFFVLIGWVPIWIVVLLALIIGLLYAKVFNNSDTGGGR